MRYLFCIPWIPKSKKNDVSVVPVQRHGKLCHTPVKGAATVRQEHAIGVLFVTAMAHRMCRITSTFFGKVLSFCKRRAMGGEGVGEKTLEKLDTHTINGQLQPAFIEAGHDVAMIVHIRIGKAKHDDRVDVELVDMGKPRRRKRTGRKFDSINVPALIADALKGRAYADDKQIIDLRCRVLFDVDEET